MAVTYDNPNGGNSGGSQPNVSYSQIVAAMPLLVGAAGYNTAAEETFSAVDWNSLGLTRIDVPSTKGFGGTDFWVFELWKRDAGSPTTANVVVTPTANLDMSAIGFTLGGVESGTYYRGSPLMMEFEGEEMPAYDVADALLNDPLMFMMFCSTEPDSALTGSGTATSIVEQNRTVFTTGYLRAWSLIASAAAPDLALSFNAYGFGGAIGLALIEAAVAPGPGFHFNNAGTRPAPYRPGLTR